MYISTKTAYIILLLLLHTTLSNAQKIPEDTYNTLICFDITPDYPFERYIDEADFLFEAAILESKVVTAKHKEYTPFGKEKTYTVAYMIPSKVFKGQITTDTVLIVWEGGLIYDETLEDGYLGSSVYKPDNEINGLFFTATDTTKLKNVKPHYQQLRFIKNKGINPYTMVDYCLFPEETTPITHPQYKEIVWQELNQRFYEPIQKHLGYKYEKRTNFLPAPDSHTSPIKIQISTTIDSVRVGESIPILITLTNTSNDTVVIKKPDFWQKGIYLELQLEGKKKWPNCRWYPNMREDISMLPKEKIIVNYDILELNPFLMQAGNYTIQIYNIYMHENNIKNKAHKNLSNTLSFYLHPTSEQEKKEIEAYQDVFGGSAPPEFYQRFLTEHPNSVFTNSVQMYYARRLGDLEHFDKSEEALLKFLDKEQVPIYLQKQASHLLRSVYRNIKNDAQADSIQQKINSQFDIKRIPFEEEGLKKTK